MLRRLLKTFFYLLYQPMAWSYDLVAWAVSLGRWKHWVQSVLPYLPGPRVLELGHGPGHLQAALAARRVHAFGLDRSRQMNRLAQRRLRFQGVPSRLIRADGQQLPHAAQAFDQVVATFPTEYIFLPGTLAELRRVLAPGGRLVLLPVAWITGRGLLDRAAAWLFRATGQAGEWSPRLVKPLRQAGFTFREERIDLDGSQVLLLLCELAP